MKKNILLSALFFLFCAASIAQETTQTPLSPEDRTKMAADRISQKLNLAKGQKDSLSLIFSQFMDDIGKYHAENNEKVLAFMTKTRDNRVKNLLRDTLKFDRYLMLMEDARKGRDTQQGTMQPRPQGGGQHNKRGGDRNF